MVAVCVIRGFFAFFRSSISRLSLQCLPRGLCRHTFLSHVGKECVRYETPRSFSWEASKLFSVKIAVFCQKSVALNDDQLTRHQV